MSQNRQDGRRWIGAEARDSHLDVERSWVIWGDGAVVPAVFASGREGDEIAEGIARGEDPGWDSIALGKRWIVVMHAEEADVDDMVAEERRARGYAPYLAEGLEQEEPSKRPAMRGVLRSDTGPRRKVTQPRPS